MNATVTATLPPVGVQVRLCCDGPRWWDVRIADERFAILTRQAEFRPKGQVAYTILDVREGVRGPCNSIGQGWHATMPDEECRKLLQALQIGAKVQAWNSGDHSFDIFEVLEEADAAGRGHVGISHRNRVSLDVGEIRANRSARWKWDLLDDVPWPERGGSVCEVVGPSGDRVGGDGDGFCVWITGPRAGQRIPLDAHGPWRAVKLVDKGIENDVGCGGSARTALAVGRG